MALCVRLVPVLCFLLACTGAVTGGGPDGSSPNPGADAGRSDDGGETAGDAAQNPCAPIAGVAYGTLPTAGAITDRPAATHADLNIKLRGWTPTTATLGLVDINGPTDTLAPQLYTLFADQRTPTFSENHRVNNWDWGQNAAAGPITESEVTLTGAVTTPGEILGTPRSGYDIGAGYQARVLYADADSITIKYTGEDNIVSGYAIHLVGLCVEPSLLALYEARNAAGRGDLPALHAGEPLGRAASTTVLISVRDTGAFMDPRARKDWWAGR
jgi:hypothetical protein